MKRVGTNIAYIREGAQVWIRFWDWTAVAGRLANVNLTQLDQNDLPRILLNTVTLVKNSCGSPNACELSFSRSSYQSGRWAVSFTYEFAGKPSVEKVRLKEIPDLFWSWSLFWSRDGNPSFYHLWAVMDFHPKLPVMDIHASSRLFI